MNVIVEIQNLKCDGCAHTIISSLNKLENISDVKINIETSQVSYNCISKEDKSIVSQELKKIGYPELEEDNTLSLKAKSYISCAIGKIKK